MAYHYEQNGEDQDLVFDGWENGIAPSPHKGVANLQNANISTEDGEVMASFGRTRNIQTAIIAGTLSPNTSTSVIYSGSPALTKGAAINISASTITNLTTGVKWVIDVSGSTIQLSTTYNGSAIGSLGLSGSATFDTFSMGIPIARTSERYFVSGTQRYRYYILDDTGRVWCYDTGLVASGYANWFLVNSSSLGTSSNAGIAILNGWLFVLTGTTVYATATTNLSDLGGTTFVSGGMINSSVPHFAYTGSQGRLYYTDGNFLGSIFPNSSLLTGGPNIQSFCSYTASTTTGTPSLISGSLPTTGGTTAPITRIPAVFFPAVDGTKPTDITLHTIYYIQYAQGTGNFQVFGPATVTGANIVAGGRGYTTGEVITVAGGSFTTPCTLTITANADGSVGGIAVAAGGSYSIEPTDPVSQSGTTGNGTGAKFNLTFSTPTAIDIQTGSVGTQYFNTFYPIGTSGVGKGQDTFVWSPERLNLPAFEISTAIGEIGNSVVIGTKGNTVYPWNQIDVTPNDLIPLPENNVMSFLTVNNMAYIFAGSKGNIYITNGSTASKVYSVPDYCAGIAGTPASYIEPYFAWGGNMYLRGRVYFSILDQNANHTTGNCGGIWSFVPTQNFFYGQETGLGLRLENQSSYGTYNGYCPVLITNYEQNVIGPQYFSAWISAYNASTGGIDASATTPVGVTVIETDLVPTGTFLNKQTDMQVEYKLSSPLASGESVSIAWRLNSTDVYTSLGSAVVESITGLSGYFPVNFEKGQWIQLKVTLTPLATSGASFVRLKELRIR